jgi:bifunctional non-homologous end joining protein LigD
MLSRPRNLPAGFIAPCLPTKTDKLPSGGQWLHAIKHDGFRVIARKNAAQVRLYSRPGNDLTHRFPLIVDALARLRSRSCIIDSEAVASGEDGRPSFDRIRYRRHDASVFLYAFDLVELNGDDLRRDPLEVRKATLASVLAKAGPGLRLNEPRLQAWLRRHRVKAARLALSLGPNAILDQKQESGSPVGQMRGRGGLGQGAAALMGLLDVRL